MINCKKIKLYGIILFGILGLLHTSSVAEAVVQKAFSITLGTNKGSCDISVVSGCEYVFSVANPPAGENLVWNWKEPEGGAWNENEKGSSATWQSPMVANNSHYTISVKVTGGTGGGEGPNWASWSGARRFPVIDVINPDIDITIPLGDPDTAPQVPIMATATCPGSGSHPLNAINIGWTEKHGHGEEEGAGTAGTLSAATTQTTGAGIATVILTTSKTTGDWHKVTATEPCTGVPGVSGKMTIGGEVVDYILVLLPGSEPPPSPSSVMVAVTGTLQLIAMGYDNGPDNDNDDGGGDDKPLGISVTWSLINKNPADVGTIDSNGTFSANKAGTCQAKATWTDPDDANNTKEDTINIVVWGVESITPSSQTVALNTETEFQIETNPTGHYGLVNVFVNGATTVIPYSATTGKITVKFDQVSSSSTDYKTVTATCGTSSVEAKTIVVEVESLRSEGTEIDDGDGNADTKTFIVQIADTGNVTVAATPNPDVAEADLPAGWILTGGTGAGKLQRTVSKTAVGTTTLTCTCGTSSKTTKIIVLGVEIDIANTSAENDDYVAVGDTQSAKARLLGPTGLTKTVNFSVAPSSKATVSPTSVSMTVGTDVNLTITGVAASASTNDTNVIAKIGTGTYGEEDCTVFGVEIDAPASFPAYVAVDEELQLGSTITPATASGGTYSWSKVTGPGNVTFSPSATAEDPTFKADEAGVYQVKVEYTKDGITISDTSGNIVVFEIEIDAPSEFPAHVGINKDLQLGSKVTPAAAEGGTYVWSKVSGPGSVTFSPNNTTEDPKFKASTAGTYQVKVAYTKGGVTVEDTSGNIVVVGVDLDIYNGGSDLDNGESAGSQGAAVSDDDEESVGAYILVNWDNDDGDDPPVPDLDESSVTKEDNLAKLVPSLDPSASTLQAGTVKLEVTAGATKIRIWRSSTKGTELTLTNSKKTWDLSNSDARTDFNSACTDGLWIEGRNWSNERGIVLKLSYKNSGGQEISSDTVKATSVILRIGNGVYRENDIPGNSARGHAGLLLGYTGNCVAADFNDDTKYRAIHMTGSGPAYTDLDDFTNTSGKDYWGAYTKSGITYAQRLKVMKSAEDIETEDPEYKWIDCLEPDGDDWDGTVEDIYALRCDGVVEVAYEINDVDVWGMTNGSTHYDIRDYLSEHNDFDLIGWSDTLMPATQCGHVTPVDADTTFGTQPICLPTSLRN